MSKRQVLCVLGVWIMIFLFLGLPSSWHKVLAIISGLLVIGIAYTSTSHLPSRSQETFVENKQQ